MFPAIHPKSFKQFNCKYTEKLHFWIKSLKYEFDQNGRLESNFKYVAIMTMLRGTMHACFSILASIVWE